MPIVPPHRIDDIVRALRAGEVVAIPTDTVYGIAAAPDRPDAVRRLADLKGRAAEQPVALLIDSVEAVAPHLDDPGRAGACAPLLAGRSDRGRARAGRQPAHCAGCDDR